MLFHQQTHTYTHKAIPAAAIFIVMTTQTTVPAYRYYSLS